jgi:hypothetical protein
LEQADTLGRNNSTKANFCAKGKEDARRHFDGFWDILFACNFKAFTWRARSMTSYFPD